MAWAERRTDASLDRPNETKPLVLRPNGNVWLDYSTDVDPVALKEGLPRRPWPP